MKYKYFCLLVISIFMCCKPSNTADMSQAEKKDSELDLSIIAQKIIDLADLQQGERVLLVMAPGEFNQLVGDLAEIIESKGAFYLGTISVSGESPDNWKTKFTQHCHGKTAEELKEIFQEVDLGIMLPGASPTDIPYKALQDILKKGTRRTIHFHWAGAYDLNGRLLETDLDKALFYQSVILETDYTALAEKQVQFENAMRGQRVKVTTPEGTDISFTIGDRPVTKQDGNASAARASRGKNLIDREIEIPSGAIRVAPIEESVQGTIAFPDSDWDGTRVNKLSVIIENGKITELSAETGIDAVKKEMEEAGEAGKSFREFALGFNPMMPIQKGEQPWIPYYGYGAGVVRLSLGDNTELGGNVSGGYVRWNFFTNATVIVGKELWVKDGVLIK